MSGRPSAADITWMRRALVLARRGQGRTSPNPMVGAVVVRKGKILGEGWHRQAGQPHAEVEALRDCERRGHSAKGATLYVTLEPCSTHGRTPPCTEAILRAGLRKVVVGAIDPNPHHSGRGLDRLREAGVTVEQGVLAERATQLNTIFNHWIVHRTPWVTLKVAMTLDGKIATADGKSKWITGELARRETHRLRACHDAILVGVNTVAADDPELTIRLTARPTAKLRIVLDSDARTPLTARLLNDDFRSLTRVVVGEGASTKRVARIRDHVEVWTAPRSAGRIDLPWLMKELGRRNLSSLWVEGGGEVHASFLEARLAHEFVGFYAPKLLGGRDSIRAVGGQGCASLADAIRLRSLSVRRFGPDMCIRSRIEYPTTGNP